MNPSVKQGASRPLTLSRALLRAHVVCALIAVSLAGGSLMIAGMLQLRALVDNNLQLVARSIAYTVEAAVVFHDQVATQDSITRIASAADVEAASVFDRNGRLLAAWQRSRNNTVDPIRRLGSRLLLSGPIAVPVLNDGVTVGEIRIQGSPDNLLGFLVTGFVWIVACMILSVASTLYLSRRIFNSITTPLGELTRVTHQVRAARSFGKRVPPARITELNDLASDFNGLLDELEKWEAGMQHENKSLAHQATHDSLTGLPNRLFFEGQLVRAVELASTEDQRFAVLFLDGDRFKEVNDTLGHAAGDRVLATLAARIRGQVRIGDIVARLGGDEFGALLAPLRDAEDARRIADNIAAAMREPIVLDDGTKVTSSVSVGIAVYPDDGLDATGLVRAADAAMYLTKTRYRKTRRGGAAQPRPAI